MVKTFSTDLGLADQQILQTIEEHGLQILYISEANGLPGWAFSIGLYANYRHPEIVLFGLPFDVSHQTINNVAHNVKLGKKYDAGFEYSDVFEGLTCIFHWVDKSWYPLFLGTAEWFYDGEEFPALQCFWPNKEQNYPWRSKLNKENQFAQPLLFRQGVTAAKVEGFLRSMYEFSFVEKLKAVTDLTETADCMTSACKIHRYDPTDWPFENPKRMMAFAPPDISNGTVPVLGLSHEQDGVWLFISRDSGATEDLVEICFGCMYERDASLSILADLPRSWIAKRASSTAVWQRKPIPMDSEVDES